MSIYAIRNNEQRWIVQHRAGGQRRPASQTHTSFIQFPSFKLQPNPTNERNATFSLKVFVVLPAPPPVPSAVSDGVSKEVWACLFHHHIPDSSANDDDNAAMVAATSGVDNVAQLSLPA